ncbi:uncharacterized protein LOC127869452 [Dreissena polymorpha]|uniref:NACHT domain-containing protein n=1 Tax=Dreissena polymorpha TaxID=45954 RepID=A0A9D4RNP5_DREPO|nr:uncharacterized protein LOC127869452 [Dreissena polymorpha]XP_052267996.1 uncharacterized protein LOC127869452 [Dreissena polymorpha]KAH3875656.1 hypothetical protein DPMN_038929 [Dreissena polymorpha]
MANSYNMFNEQETNNWIKASLALTITKNGLTNFIEAEMRKVQATVGRSCGKCAMENLIPCSTKNQCKKRKIHISTFHQFHQNKQCCICEKVMHTIEANHRFKGPSWENTKAELWATDWWEIAKCFLPPNGYSDVSSVHESDFNGLINVMINCSHFETCLSTSLNPKPPDPQCPLEKARQIGRDVRHSAKCKITDADLQNYFQTLNLLLRDPSCLVHDQSAASALAKLSDLQNDRISLTELGTLLREAQQTLINANKAGEKFAEKARSTLEEVLAKIEQFIQAGEKRIDEKTVEAENKITEKTQDATNYIDRKTQDATNDIDRKTHESEVLIHQRIQQFNKSKETHVSDQTENDYELGITEMIRYIKRLYGDRFSHVPSSPLNESIDVKLNDVYMLPNLQLMCKDKGAFRKTGKQVKKYRNVFVTENKFNRRTFIQGEAGSGKSTFTAKLTLDWSGKATPIQHKKNSYAFDDLPTFKFVFHITLRNSVTQYNIFSMIKEQIIDCLYADESRANAYELLNEIMTKERCLVVLDGLDEWRSLDDKLALPYLLPSHRKCILLITTRPWKLANGKIKHSDIDTLFEMEGINDHVKLCKKILARLVDGKDFENKHCAFKSYVDQHKLQRFLKEPMFISLIVSSWVDGLELTGSRCEIYSLLLDSLLKKPTKEPQHFQEPPFQCFKETQYIQPNIENLNVVSHVAFELLFSDTRANSLFFSETELSKYMRKEHKEFALKSGILSQTSTPTLTRSSSSFSFVNRSVQEFLIAYFISCNSLVLDDVVSEYLKRYDEAYLEISHVFIFVCGMNMSAANKLSCLMDERDYTLNSHKYIDAARSDGILRLDHKLQRTLLSGYIEATANNNSNVLLALSQFDFNFYSFILALGLNVFRDLKPLQHIWNLNRSNARALCYDMSHVYRQDTDSSNVFWFDLDLCSNINIETLILHSSNTVLPNALGDLKMLKYLFLDCKYDMLHLPAYEYLESLHIGRGVTSLSLHCFNYKTLKYASILSFCDGLDLSLFENLESLEISENVTILNKPFRNHSKLKRIKLQGFDFASLETSAIKSWCLLNNSDTYGCTERLPVLPSLEKIVFENNILSNFLHRLLCTLLSCDRQVQCKCVSRSISSADVDSNSLTGTKITTSAHGSLKLTLFENLESLFISKNVALSNASKDLLNALYCLNIKSLTLGDLYKVWKMHTISNALVSLTQLKTLTMHLDIYTQLQLPKSVNNLIVTFRALIPSELNTLVHQLASLNQSLKCELYFLCRDSGNYAPIMLKEYDAIKQNIYALKNVEVTQFQMYKRERAKVDDKEYVYRHDDRPIGCTYDEDDEEEDEEDDYNYYYNSDSDSDDDTIFNYSKPYFVSVPVYDGDIDADSVVNHDGDYDMTNIEAFDDMARCIINGTCRYEQGWIQMRFQIHGQKSVTCT